MNEEIVTEKSFLQIKSIRTSSNASMMKLKEGDVIIALDGEMVHKSYEELSKELSEIKEKKVITLFRDGVFFNTFIYGSLGVICENITSEKIPELEISNINDHFQKDEFYTLYEVYKKPGSNAILLNKCLQFLQVLLHLYGCYKTGCGICFLLPWSFTSCYL